MEFQYINIRGVFMKHPMLEKHFPSEHIDVSSTCWKNCLDHPYIVATFFIVPIRYNIVTSISYKVLNNTYYSSAEVSCGDQGQLAEGRSLKLSDIDADCYKHFDSDH